MHKSYTPYAPVASKLLQKRWDATHYENHQKSVRHAKPMIDSRPPLTYMHLHLKLKKLQLEEERLATIERDNRILLEKMATIMRTKGRVDNQNDVEFKSLSKGRRERELLRITKENQTILKRILSQKPEISSKELRKDWETNVKFLNNIAAFPEDWYKKNDKSARSKSACEPAREPLTSNSALGQQKVPPPQQQQKKNEVTKKEEATQQNYDDDFEK